MEATIQTNNQAINIDINVSINFGELKANIQRGLQAIKQCVRSIDVGNVLSDLWIGGWSVACFYLIYMYA